MVAALRAAGCVYAEDEAAVLLSAAGSAAALAALVAQRTSGLPLEQVVGWARFCGLRIAVEPGVFVPRRRTEHLVRTAVEHAGPGALVVDLCCGSGAAGVAVAHALAAGRGRVELHAADLDPVAVRCARRNVEPAGGQVHEGDLYDALPDTLEGRVDVLLVNAPYVPTAELALLPPEARLHEPRAALDGGADGLEVQRRVVSGAPRWLAPGGHLLVETSAHQAPRTAEAFRCAGLDAQVTVAEELDATVVVGHRTGRSTRQRR